jgi:hypothetical protein
MTPLVEKFVSGVTRYIHYNTVLKNLLKLNPLYVKFLRTYWAAFVIHKTVSVTSVQNSNYRHKFLMIICSSCTNIDRNLTIFVHPALAN